MFNIEQEYIENNEKVFVAVDVETTGFSPIKNELIEISAIKYQGGKKVAQYSTLIKPKNLIPYQITNITGITNQMVEKSPEIEEIIPELIDFIGKHTIIAHNASFDMSFLQTYSNYSFSENEVIDTVKISRMLHPELHNHKLATVAKYIGINEGSFHRAEFDCECCAKIYVKYIESKLL